MSEGTHRSASADALLREADKSLARRDCGRALTDYDWAELAGADGDRCASGRWMADMLLGQYEEAWRESDAIRERGAPDRHRFWTGEPVDGSRVMVRCLHGYGDTVMYLRWLPELMQRCTEVTVQACPEMLPLLRAMPSPTRLMTWLQPGETDRGHWDEQVETAELPYLFRTTVATLPPPVPLRFSEAALHRVRTRMGVRTRPRVGLVWTGSSYDASRSIPFAEFRGLLEHHGVEFWSLQAPAANAEWVDFCAERGWGARNFRGHDAEGRPCHDGIADMAAFASEMDLVITIDTLAAHVAGSIGLPTWVLLKREADWRWMLDRDDSPWYPTMRLFRQSRAGDWDEPLARVAAALCDLCEEQNA